MRRTQRGDALVFAPHIVYASDPDLTWYGGGRFSNAWGFRANLQGEGQSAYAPGLTEHRTEFAPGCCKLVSAELFKTEGLYDEDFFVYWEDVDLCWRWSRAHIEICFLPKPIIQHEVSALTGGTKSVFSMRMYHLNQLIFLRKHFPLFSVILRALLILSKIALRLVVLQDTPAQSLVRLRAFVEGLRFTISPKSGYNSLDGRFDQ
jgi:GT2 family glycosyltransferase